MFAFCQILIVFVKYIYKFTDKTLCRLLHLENESVNTPTIVIIIIKMSI